MEREPIVVTGDQWQRRRLKLPGGDVRLGDGRVLRPRVGYDIKKFGRALGMNKATINGFLENRGWYHADSDLGVAATIDDTPRWGPLLHVSMSHSDHDPSWETIKLVKAAFFPLDMDAMMMLPREADYVNIHRHTFHLIQCPQEWGIQ